MPQPKSNNTWGIFTCKSHNNFTPLGSQLDVIKGCFPANITMYLDNTQHSAAIFVEQKHIQVEAPSPSGVQPCKSCERKSGTPKKHDANDEHNENEEDDDDDDNDEEEDHDDDDDDDDEDNDDDDDDDAHDNHVCVWFVLWSTVDSDQSGLGWGPVHCNACSPHVARMRVTWHWNDPGCPAIHCFQLMKRVDFGTPKFIPQFQYRITIQSKTQSNRKPKHTGKNGKNPMKGNSCRHLENFKPKIGNKEMDQNTKQHKISAQKPPLSRGSWCCSGDLAVGYPRCRFLFVKDGTKWYTNWIWYIYIYIFFYMDR